jgi:hypothetical protein
VFAGSLEEQPVAQVAQRPFGSHASTPSRVFASVRAESRRREFRPTNNPTGPNLASFLQTIHLHYLLICRHFGMGLLGCYSNPEIQERLRRLSEKLEELAASNAAPRSSARRDRKLRGGLVPNAVERVMAASGEPMRARDVHAEVEKLLGMPVPASSVKNWLAKQVQDRQSRVVRVGHGRYRLA